MIADWVLYEGEPYQIRRLGIYGVDRDGEDYPAVCVGKPTGIGLIVERNEIEPIPLTPEILEKIGFKNKGTLWYLEEDNFELEHNNNDSFIWIVGDVYIVALIKYVHELQQALRLSKIEKEIKL